MSPGAESLAILTRIVALSHKFLRLYRPYRRQAPQVHHMPELCGVPVGLAGDRAGTGKLSVEGEDQLSSHTSRAQCHTDSQLSSPTISSSASHSTTVPSSSTQ